MSADLIHYIDIIDLVIELRVLNIITWILITYLSLF